MSRKHIDVNVGPPDAGMGWAYKAMYLSLHFRLPILDQVD